MIVASIGRARGDHRYTQAELSSALRSLWADEPHRSALLERFQRSVEVESRFLALTIEEELALRDFGARNDAFIRVGTELGEKAARRALEDANVDAREIDAIFFTTVTGVATPTIDARLVERLGLRDDVRRYPFFGAGPFGRHTARVVHGRAFFVGDAAGFLDPLTGEGVRLALGGARALVACVVGGRPEAYQAAWRRVVRRYWLLTSLLLAIRRRPRLRNRIVPAVARFPALFDASLEFLTSDDLLLERRDRRARLATARRIS